MVLDDRGQTLNDYAVGVSIFVLAVITVVAQVPAILAPYAAPIDDDTAVQAERSAGLLLDALTVEGSRTTLDVADTEAFFASHESSVDLRGVLGLPSTASVNVSVENAATGVDVTHDGTRFAAGRATRDGATAVVARVVSFDGRTCRLVVRVW